MSANALIFLGLFTVYAALMGAMPALPPIARAIGISEFQTGVLISLSALLMALMSPFWGSCSERWGRKRVFLIGLFGISASLLIFALVLEMGLSGQLSGLLLFAVLVATRLPLGMTAAAVGVSAQAYVADTTPPDQRSAGMAMIGAANALGTVVGPALAAGLLLIGLLAPFYVGATLVFILALALVFLMPDVRPQPTDHTVAKLRPWQAHVRPFLLIGFSAVLTISILQITIGFLLIDRFDLAVDAAARYAAVAFFVAGLVLVLVQGVLIKRLQWQPPRLIRFGLPLMLVGCLCLLWAPELWVVYVAFGLIAFGGGLTFPGYQAAVTLVVGNDQQGAVAGLVGAANASGAVVGPLAGTLLYQAAPQLTYLGIALLLLALSVFVWFSPRVSAAIPQASPASTP